MALRSRRLRHCPRCDDRNQLPAGAHAFHCLACDHRWRRALCGGCGGLDRAPERSSSWRCSSCGMYNRSYWRAASQADIITGSVAVSRRLAVQERRGRHRAVTAGLAAGSIVLVLVHAAVTGARATGTESTSRAVCVRVERLMRQEAGGAVASGALVPRLQEVLDVAGGATPEVRSSVSHLTATAVRGSGDPAFQAAAAHVSSVCETARGTENGG